MSDGFALDRWLTRLRHRHSGLRHALPFPVVRALLRGRARLLAVRARLARVEYRSPMVNLYHCSVHKTGSQWITAVLSDLVTYRHCGLVAHQYQHWRPEGYDPRPIPERTFDRPFPRRTIVTPLYVDREGYRRIPRPEPHRTFFVLRDPRDVLLSWYYSAKFSHIAMGDIPELRRRLQALDEEAGMIEAIHYLDGHGLFATLASWRGAEVEDERVRVVRYEELSSPRGLDAFRALFAHLDVRLPDDLAADLVEAYSFSALSGRKRGEEDPRSHVRSGKAGGWRGRLAPRVVEELRRRTGDLPMELGYPDYDADGSGAA